VLEALASPVGIVLRTIHDLVTSAGLPSDSGWAWGLSIVFLTIFVRLILFPLFVKQIRSQRRMQEIAPMVKELQKKHKGDRETLNKELMALYKNNNANPIAGCLPLLLQLPVFFALFHVIRHFGPDKEPRYGLSADQLEEGGAAQIFGAPVAANFRSSVEQLAILGADSPTTVRIVAAIMVVLMGATTYWTQRQMIARAGATDPQQIMIQKFLLYVLPFSFAISGVIFPIGVLLYWVTTNIWSMGQQAYVIKRMPPPLKPGETAPANGKNGKTGKDGSAPVGPAGGAAASTGPASGSSTGSSTGKAKGKRKAAAGTTGGPGAGAPTGTPGAAAPASSAAGPGGRRPANAPKGRAAGSRRNKNRKGGRR
jgi:YidC/Oxa1 family membrane protein insertase